MAKLKKARVRIHICPTCKGNGFVKVASIERNDYTVHQCWDCDSEGEFYETNHDDLIDDGSFHSLH